MFYEIGIRIPIVTALTEELLFGSVLLAVLMAITSTTWAVGGRQWCLDSGTP